MPQMLFYLANAVKGYGGDEGLNIRVRSLFALGGHVLDLKNPFALYYVAVGVLALTLVALARFAPSRFGRAVLALRDDDVRAEALGFPTYRYKLASSSSRALAGRGGLSGTQCYVDRTSPLTQSER